MNTSLLFQKGECLGMAKVTLPPLIRLFTHGTRKHGVRMDLLYIYTIVNACRAARPHPSSSESFIHFQIMCHVWIFHLPLILHVHGIILVQWYPIVVMLTYHVYQGNVQEHGRAFIFPALQSGIVSSCAFWKPSINSERRHVRGLEPECNMLWVLMGI